MKYITALDNEILWILKDSLTGEIFQTLAIFIFKLSQMGFAWVLFSALLLLRKKQRRAGLSVLAALLIGGGVSMLLNHMIYRCPPFMADADIVLAVEVLNASSFPSVAICMCFSAAVAFSIQNRQWSTLAVLAAALSALSFLFLMVCYPTDALASIFLAMVSGNIAVMVVNKLCYLTGACPVKQ